MVHVSVLTYCRGRLGQARRFIPAALASLRPGDELVLVDYSCPERVHEFALSLKHPFLTIVCTIGREFWEMNHARNLAFRASSRPICIFWDIDWCIDPLAVDWARMLPQRAFGTQRGGLGTWGWCAVHRDEVLRVGGYEEGFVGYGVDDYQFYDSLLRAGGSRRICPVDVVRAEVGGQSRDLEDCRLRRWIACNRTIAVGLRSMHPFRNNLSRTWGWGGVVVKGCDPIPPCVAPADDLVSPRIWEEFQSDPSRCFVHSRNPLRSDDPEPLV